MSFDQNILILSLSLASTWIVAFGITRWTRSRDVTSVHAQDSSLEDVGLSTLSAMFSQSPADLGNGLTELRPTWGLRLFAPLIAMGFLIITDLAPVFDAVGLRSAQSHQMAFGALCVVFGYVWFMLLFQQRVVWGRGLIATYGMNMRRHVRAMDDLNEIRLHESRPALVLTFSDQKPLYIPKFLSHRDMFLNEVQEIAHANVNNGTIIPMPVLRQRLGL